MEKILVWLCVVLPCVPLHAATAEQITLHGVTDLMRLCVYSDLQAVHTALDDGVDVHASDARGNTAIFYAIVGENTDFARMIVQALITKDATVVNAADNKKYTPLMYAALLNRLGIMKDLIAAGANVQAKNDKNNTALLLVASDEREELGMTLVAAHVAKKASVDGQNSQGVTALMIACSHGRLALAKALLQAGADPLLKNAVGCTALRYARESRRAAINRLFSK